MTGTRSCSTDSRSCSRTTSRSVPNGAELSLAVGLAVARLRKLVGKLATRTKRDRVVLMAGTDHQPPQDHTKLVCEALAAETGWNVRRGLLRDFVEPIEVELLPL